jgi:hypothetical protein
MGFHGQGDEKHREGVALGSEDSVQLDESPKAWNQIRLEARFEDEIESVCFTGSGALSLCLVLRLREL